MDGGWMGFWGLWMMGWDRVGMGLEGWFKVGWREHRAMGIGTFTGPDGICCLVCRGQNKEI